MESFLAPAAFLKLPENLLPEPAGLTLSNASLQGTQLAIQVSQGLLVPSSVPANLVPVSVSWPEASLVTMAADCRPVHINGTMVADTSLTHSLELQQLLAAQPTAQLSMQPCSQPVLLQQRQHTPGSSTVFFAGVTPIVAAETLLALFAQFGRVMDLNLFRPYKGCKTSKGCGLVVFSQQCEAAAALDALNGRFVWPGARSPMVIEWCDPTKQHKRKRAQPLTRPLLHQVAAISQQPLSGMLSAVPISLGYLPTCNAGRLVMPGH